MFRNCRLARMSDGHYCFVRDLGPVKGGKGMKHHEVIVDFNRHGMVALFKTAFARLHGLRDGPRSEPRTPAPASMTGVRRSGLQPRLTE
jgi:hypothetical protein